MRKKQIIELHYNYRQALSDGREILCEDWDTAKLGVKEVVLIEEHLPMGDGDRLYYDIFYSNDTIVRTFNPCKVIFQLIK